MGYRHTREELLQGAVDAALEDGLHRLTFGRLATRLGVTDRAIVYYFPSKDDLVTQVLTVLGDRLVGVLADAVSGGARDHRDLVARAWPVLARPQVDPLFALYFEAVGLATAGAEPYRSLAAPLVAGWVDWFATVLVGTPAVRRREAEAALALVDGLLLLRQLAGPAAANRAAKVLVG
ncbi:TetR/AcrR family transcriptional regulator [Nocardioides rubriscoriae]|uniref:TetR/AcrR family transcriptional regulator n=1 Tax=Nocardioides rubriscoriae TaxID=642762 RepID=UPI0011E04E20|nr:TetR/AcrR family transcriptional regulator [Nocardioides rubriscoriae]